MKQLSILVAIVWLVGTINVRGQEDFLGGLASDFDIDGVETTFDPETGIATATGDVTIKFGTTTVTSDEATYNMKTGEIVAIGDAVVVKDGQTYKGDRISYNTETGVVDAGGLQTNVADPLLVNTKDIKIDSTRPDDPITLHNATITTHDRKNPNYRIVAKTMTIYPEDRVVFKSVKIYAGKTPVLWLPYFSQPLDDELGYTFAPGYGTNWGAFLLNQYGVALGDHTIAKFQLDLRSSRGVAGGVELNSRRHKQNENFGRLYLYYAYDTNPTDGVATLDRQDVDNSRYRINLQHRIYLPGPDESSFYLDFDINKLSDQYFYQDFFFREALADPRPDNLINLVKSTPRGTLSIFGRFRFNDFFQTDTRSPEIALDFTRQPIFGSNFYYVGETTFGVLREYLATTEERRIRGLVSDGEAEIDAHDASVKALARAGADVIGSEFDRSFDRDVAEVRLEYLRQKLSEPEFNRFHTYNEILYPIDIGDGKLSFVPRVGGGVTTYSNVSGNLLPPDETTFRGVTNPSSGTRTIGHVGFDLSTKFSRVYSDVHWPKLGVDEIRHIVQPYVNYSVLAVDGAEDVPQIDRLTPSQRLRPIDVPGFTATDGMNSWNVVRLGLRNLWQTKRTTSKYDWAGQRNFSYAKGSTTHDWAGIHTAIDLFVEDPEYDRKMSNFFNEIFWQPVPWLRIAVDSQVPLDDNPFNFTEVNSSITWMPTKNFSTTFSNLFLSDNPFFEDSNLLTWGNYFRLNDRWAVSTTHRYEVDDSTLEYQGYSLHYDLTSWTATLGGLVRDNRLNGDEFGVVFTMTLKDFPSVRIPLDFGTLLDGFGGTE